jgi:hypothetical protein
MATSASFEALQGRRAPHPLIAAIHHLPHVEAPAIGALVAFAVLFSVVTRGPQGSFDGVPARAAPFGEVWIGTRTTAANLASLDAPTTSTFLGGSTSFGLGGWGSAAPAVAWASEARFADDLLHGRIPADVRVVMYDPEAWGATPVNEQMDPARAMQRFESLARTHGYVVVITPHPSLVTVAGAACAAGPGEAIERAFLRCRIEAEAARYADVVEVQAQYLEAEPEAYRSFVSAAARQARGANPGVLVISGLSTTYAQDPSTLYTAWRSVLGTVDGHYLNVPHGRRPETALAFLRLVMTEAEA